MQVHDTDKLVRRAHMHHEIDGRIEQGTYGQFLGDENFRGCQIACLSTPAVPKATTKFLRDLRGGKPSDSREFAAYGLGEELQMKRIESQFGIHRSVSRIGELAFERAFKGQPEEARLFVPQFAEAFNEGAWIDLEMALKFQREQETRFYNGVTPEYAERVLDWIAGVTERPRGIRAFARARTLITG